MFKDTFENVDSQEEKEEEKKWKFLCKIAGGFWAKHTVKGTTPF